MADFCTKCAQQLDFPRPDIDILKELEPVQNGYLNNGFLCEGCGICGVGRKEDGTIFAQYAPDGYAESLIFNDLTDPRQQITIQV